MESTPTRQEFETIAREARLKTLELIYKAQTSHIGSNFSAIDIFTVLFDQADPERDEVILSAGWKAAAWYYFLWKKGIITEEELNSFCQPGSSFIGLVEPMNRWGLRFAGGSMGYGLPFAVGVAMTKKLKDEGGTVYCFMSDGELQIGTTWESALIAGKHKLDNLVVIVDNNGFQAMGKTGDILTGYFPALGDEWKCQVIDGHDYGVIGDRLFGYFSKFTMPKVIIANTIKGKGVKRFEGNNLYHYKQLSEEEYLLAKRELNNFGINKHNHG